MTATQIRNHVYYVVCLIVAVYAELPSTALNVVPAKWREVVVAAAIAAGWVKAHWNLFLNPDGTAAQTAWTPKP